MAGKRSWPDRGSAPDDESGAEPFAGGGDPKGIVRLSDLVASRTTSRGPASPRADTDRRRPQAATGVIDADGTGRPYAHATQPESAASDSTSLAAVRRRNGTANRGGPSAGRRRLGDRAYSRSREGAAQDVGLDDANHVAMTPDASIGSRKPGPPRGARHEPDASDAGVVDVDEGPAYESLFGTGGDAQRRPRRERKPASAVQRALGLLTRREHSRKELVRKLVSRGVDADEVRAAVDRLSDAGWQDERRFAESLVRSRASAGYGPLHVRAELGTHDLPAEVRQAALDDFEGDWAEIARDAVERRFGRIEDRRTRERKAADYLVRRGFPADIVRSVVRFPDDD